MRKLLFIIALFVFLAFFIIASYHALAVQSKQRQLTPVEVEDVTDTQFERLATSLRFKTTPDLNEEINDKWKYWLKNTYTTIKNHPKIEVIQEFPNSLVYRWLGRNPISKPLLFVSDVEVEEPVLENIPQWEFNPFMGKRTEKAVFGAGARKGKAHTIAWMEAVHRLCQTDFEPSRTTYWVVSYGKKDAWTIAQSLENNGIIPEFILANQEASLIEQDAVSAGVDAPLALLGISQKNNLAVRLWSSEAAPLEKTIATLKEKTLPIDLYQTAPHLFLEYLTPEANFGQRLWYANRTWLSYAPTQTVAMLESYPLVANMFRTTFTDAPIINENGVSEVLLTFHLSPHQQAQDVVNHVWQSMDTTAIQLIVDEPMFSQVNIAPSTDAYGFEATHSSIKQLFPDVVVLPSVSTNATIASYFQTLSPNLYHFSPLGSHPSDKTGVNESIEREEYARMIQFYEQFIRNVVE